MEVSWVDSTDANNYKTAIKSNTKVCIVFPHLNLQILYGETPANPTLSLLDLEAFAKIGKEHSILTVVDRFLLYTLFLTFQHLCITLQSESITTWS